MGPHVRRWHLALLAMVTLAACAGGERRLGLRKVMLYRNGVGYFERQGLWRGRTYRLAVTKHELDDVLKTLTVVDRRRGTKVPTFSASIAPAKAKQRARELTMRLGGEGPHDLSVRYAVPSPAWKSTYRLVLDAKRKKLLLQAWAVVNNVTEEDWDRVQLTLGTGAPMTFASNLHRPTFVSRPNMRGVLVKPVATGAVQGERLDPADPDGDGVVGERDLCPNDAEDKDGFEDDDGCPDPDNDKDRILDDKDKCPNEPEVYNGYQDADGCPDKGRVVVQRAAMRILDRIYFAKDSAEIRKVSLPIVNAVAATLKGNPQLRVEVQGHAARDDKDAWGISARRAGALRRALVQRGVRRGALEVAAYGVTRPIRRGVSKDDLAANRRVEFLVIKSGDAPLQRQHTSRAPVVTPKAVKVRRRAGMSLYRLPGLISIAAGATSIIALLSREVEGEEVYLYRPDANLPGSDRHPQRAVLFRNASELELSPGPVAVFARGTFVGEGIMTSILAGARGLVPFGLDRSTTVSVVRKQEERKGRITAIKKGEIELEDYQRADVTYRLAAGPDVPSTAWVKHRQTSGYQLLALPKASQRSPGAVLVPLRARAGQVTQLTISEQRPERSRFSLRHDDPLQLAPYLKKSTVAPKQHALLTRLVAKAEKSAKVEKRLVKLRRRIAELGIRGAELRVSIQALRKRGGAGRLVRKLSLQLDRSGKELAEVSAKLSELSISQDKLFETTDQLRDELSR